MPIEGPVLTIDLSAIAANRRLLKERFSGAECGAVVKANAYGLGVEAVSRRLYEEGCRNFFVATPEEGVALSYFLRATSPHASASDSVLTSAAPPHLSAVAPPGYTVNRLMHRAKAEGGSENLRIYVFHGPYPGEERNFLHHQLIPVLNSVEQLQRWNVEHPFALMADTGMNRLGLTISELEAHSQLATYNLQLLLSHLACANDPRDPENAAQLERFRRARALLPKIPASLCNSSGIFLDREFHFDVARPGCALYGINPTGKTNPMRQVVNLAAPILQIRTAEETGYVGYGATHEVKKGARLAVIQLGYADGYSRILSNKGVCFIGGHEARLAGRVSMDMVTADVSAIPEAALAEAAHAEFINARQTVDDLARAAATIGYEVLTRLGNRVRREYK